jgi:hypothetical protein
MSVARPKPSERRDHYRLDTNAKLRLRKPSLVEATPASGDAVDKFEALAAAATRFRKEASPAGRVFVDKLMATLDALVGEASQTGGGSGDWCPALVLEVNLSAGGVGFPWSQHIDEGSRVEVEFSIDCDQTSVPFRLDARVARCRPLREGYNLGLEFTEMAAPTQQRLVRLLFDLQRLQLRRRSK